MADNALTKIGNVMSRWFRITPDSNGTALQPARADEKGRVLPFKHLPDPVKRAWTWWLTENLDGSKDIINRKTRYEDCDFAARNDAVIGSALNLYADEIINTEAGEDALLAEAPDPKVADASNELLEKWGYGAEKLRVLAYDMCKFGDAFTIKSLSEREGILDQTILSPYDIHDRMEFDASRFDLKKYGTVAFNNRMVNLQKVAAYMQGKSSDSLTDVSQFYKSYLFGFVMTNGLVLPPWMVSHFRIQTTTKEIWPFGISDLAHTISTFRQLVSSKNLQGVARMMGLPLEIFKVKTSPGATKDEIFRDIQEFKEQFETSGNNGNFRDDSGLSNRIWTAMDSLEVEIKDRQHNLDQIADLEYLRDDEIMSLLIPKGWLIVDKASFGSSGQALVQQYKPFGRRVFSRQTIMMREIANDIKLHFAMTNQFEGANTEFTLKMNFPQIEESRDRVQQKGDTFRLAMDVYQGIKGIAGVPEGVELPANLVKQLFTRLSFMTSQEVDDWVGSAASFAKKERDKAEKEQVAAMEAGEGEESAFDQQEEYADDLEKAKNYKPSSTSREKPKTFETSQALFGGKRLTESQRNKVTRLLYEDHLLTKVLFESRRKRGIKEGLQRGKHFFNSWSPDADKKQVFEDMMARRTSRKLLGESFIFPKALE